MGVKTLYTHSKLFSIPTFIPVSIYTKSKSINYGDLMKKLLLALLITASSSAAIVTQQIDGCTNFILDNDRELQGQSKVVHKKISYGLYIKDMEIDFNQRKAFFDLKTAVSLGFDTTVTSDKISINESHPRFNEFINLLQKDLYFFKEVCLDSNNEVVKFKVK
jgi:hypothetical protein